MDTVLRLMLLRHAKSDWGDPSLDDFDRPLNPRGLKAADMMAGYLSETCPPPDLILCSTALRTRETLAELLPFLTVDTDIQLRGELYEDSELDYLSLLQNLDTSAETVLVIGHNPAIEETAALFYGSGLVEGYDDMAEKYPTGALAIFTFPHRSWSDLGEGSGTLERFVKPRDLEDHPEL